MKTMWIGAVAVLAILIALPGSTHAQSAQTLPIPSVDSAIDFPNEHEMPDPSLTYKIVFDIGKASPKIDEVNPGSHLHLTVLQHARQGRRPGRSQKIRRGISSGRHRNRPE